MLVVGAMDHYRTLEVEPSAGDSQLWSAYRRKALATHPDKGGSSEAFRAVVTAFDVRNVYQQVFVGLRLRHKQLYWQ